MLRLFIGIPMPEMVTERLSGLASGLPGARWVPPENYHLTLRFLGELDEGTAHDVDEALDLVTGPAFPLTLSGLGSFGKGHKQHALWAGLAESEPLRHLQAKIESGLVRAGLPVEERKFSPHVTLAYLKETPAEKLANYMGANGMFQAGPFMVDRYCLYESVLGKSGATYHVLQEYPLGGWVP
ncbi:RNA 2',3'-cyclic phosphodiesterase [Niveispirillum sp. KHB5.9]|uniref:RNA 2',3'-cyclic phosphodiesterase n=1 Tax=Niveispirillum sp. KHB5.9 TaxID=3400269 RepID=UPI003A8B3486